MSGAKRVARVKRRAEARSSGGSEEVLDIWDSSEPPPSPTLESGGIELAAPGFQTAASGSVFDSAPPSARGTLFGTAPPPERSVQATSVSPPSPSAPPPSPVPAPLGAADTQGTVRAPLVSTPPESVTNGARTPIPRGVLVPGEQFGVYRIGACIGEGGMARIYQAEHAGLRRQVALKVLLDATTRVPEGRERFLREARIAAAIKHPNVVNIFDVGVHEDTAFLVMELLQGTDLEQLIETKGALDEGTIVDIMVPVVAGLSAVHDAGVVHRDLKPGNVFLAQGLYDEVDPKLLDFGICKAPGPEQLRLTANGMLIGTPFYMSPEGLRGEDMTPRSDQYSLGVVMYECATGTNPFHATTFAEIFRLIGAGEYPAPSSTRPQISKRLERIIMRAMSLDPADRFTDLREMGRELLLLAGQRTRITWSLSFGDLERPKAPASNASSAPPKSPPPSAPPPHDSALRPRLARWAPLLIVAGVLLFALSSLFSSAPHPEGKAAGSTVPSVTQAVAPPPVLVAPSPIRSQPEPVAPTGVAQRAAGSPDVKAPSSSPPAHSLSVSRRAHTSSAPPSPKSEESEPEWEIQPTFAGTAAASGPPRPAQPRTQIGVGANGAPIFD